MFIKEYWISSFCPHVAESPPKIQFGVHDVLVSPKTETAVLGDRERLIGFG